MYAWKPRDKAYQDAHQIVSAKDSHSHEHHEKKVSLKHFHMAAIAFSRTTNSISNSIK
jgi:hypothetical protein